MLKVHLPDGAVVEHSDGVTAAEVVEASDGIEAVKKAIADDSITPPPLR